MGEACGSSTPTPPNARKTGPLGQKVHARHCRELCIGHAGEAGPPPPVFLDRPLEAFVGVLREVPLEPRTRAALQAAQGRYLLEFSRFGARGGPHRNELAGCRILGRGFSRRARARTQPDGVLPRLRARSLGRSRGGARPGGAPPSGRAFGFRPKAQKRGKGGEAADGAGATADGAEAVAELLLSLGLVAPRAGPFFPQSYTPPWASPECPPRPSAPPRRRGSTERSAPVMRQPAGTSCGWQKPTRPVRPRRAEGGTGPRPAIGRVTAPAAGRPARLAAARRRLSRPAPTRAGAGMPMSAGPDTSAATRGGAGPPECARGGPLGPPPTRGARRAGTAQTHRQDTGPTPGQEIIAPAPGHPLWPIVARQ